MLRGVAVCCSLLQCVGVGSCVMCVTWVVFCCGVLQCVAVRCSASQCVAVRRSVLQCVAVCSCVTCVTWALFCSGCCSVLQCVAVRCSLLVCDVCDIRLVLLRGVAVCSCVTCEIWVLFCSGACVTYEKFHMNQSLHTYSLLHSECHEISISNRNRIGLFSTERGKRDLENQIIDWELGQMEWHSKCNRLYLKLWGGYD